MLRIKIDNSNSEILIVKVPGSPVRIEVKDIETNESMFTYLDKEAAQLLSCALTQASEYEGSKE